MIRPLGARVVIEPVKVEERTTSGGIVIPETTHWANTYKGEVLAIGDVEKVKVGDLILFTLGAGDRVEYENEQLAILDEDEILAILDR